MAEPQVHRATLPSGDVLGVVTLPNWSPCVVLVDVSGSLGSAGVERALAAGNAILRALPERRWATAVAYAQRAVLSGLLARAPRPELSAAVIDRVGLRLTCDAAAWDLVRRELRRWNLGPATPEVVWISDFADGDRAAPEGYSRVHRLAVSGRCPSQTSARWEVGPQGELPAELLAELEADPGELSLSLDHPGRWFHWNGSELNLGPQGSSAQLAPASGSLAWVAVPHARVSLVEADGSRELPFADGPPPAEVLDAVGEVVS